MAAVTNLDKAKAQIVLDHPFFASLLLRHPIQERTDIPTLAVDAKGQIYYNAKFIESLTVPQLVWGLCHEVMHKVGQHATRMGSRDHRKWNYAGDAWINDTLDACGIGQRIENTVNMKGSKDDTVENIYDSLPDNPNGGSAGAGGNSNSGSEYMDGDGLGSDVIPSDGMSESEIKELEANAKVEIAEAAQAAKMRGKMPGALEKIVCDVLNVKTPWYELLEIYMADKVANDYTWTRPNRRFIGADMYLPSVGSQNTMGEVVIQVDVSGSISQTELMYYNGHLSRIVEQCSPERVHVIYTDTQVQRHDIFERNEEVRLEYFSGGGTRMEAGFEYIEAEGIDPQVVITLTDGFDSYTTEPSFPTVWCVSSDIVPPYGMTVHFEME